LFCVVAAFCGSYVECAGVARAEWDIAYTMATDAHRGSIPRINSQQLLSFSFLVEDQAPADPIPASS
jgi:hypothetical protein